MYFEGTIKHKVMTDSGKLKKVNSVYLIDAVSHADVETRLTELAEKTVQGDFTIKPIRVSEIIETIGDPIYDNWYKLKAQYELDKKVTETYLVNAGDIRDCIERFLKHVNEHTVDYEIPAVTITKIIDVLQYTPSGFDEIYTDQTEWPATGSFEQSISNGVISVSNSVHGFDPSKILAGRIIGDQKDPSFYLDEAP